MPPSFAPNAETTHGTAPSDPCSTTARKRTARWRAAGLFLVAATLGCGIGGGPRGPVSEAFDSAGIHVVVNHDPARTGPDAWHLSDVPAVDIGGGRTPDDQLFSVRGARVLSDGRIVVANSGTGELRFYGPDGRFLCAAGGKGKGPGEVQVIAALGLLPGDTLAVFDSWLQRLTFFDGGGALVGTVRIETPPLAMYDERVLPDGSILSLMGRGFGPSAATGVYQPQLAVFLQPRDGSAPDSLGSWPGSRWYIETEGRSVAINQALVGPSLFADGSASRVWVAYSGTFELRELDRNGTTRMLVRVDRPLREVTDAAYDALVRKRLDAIDKESLRKRAVRAFEKLPRPTTFPAFAGLILDDAGEVWLPDYILPEDTSRTWHVFSPDGHWLTDLSIPAETFPQHIGANFVLALQRDSLDVEHVVRFDLIKPKSR